MSRTPQQSTTLARRTKVRQARAKRRQAREDREKAAQTLRQVREKQRQSRRNRRQRHRAQRSANESQLDQALTLAEDESTSLLTQRRRRDAIRSQRATRYLDKRLARTERAVTRMQQREAVAELLGEESGEDRGGDAGSSSESSGSGDSTEEDEPSDSASSDDSADEWDGTAPLLPDAVFTPESKSGGASCRSNGGGGGGAATAAGTDTGGPVSSTAVTTATATGKIPHWIPPGSTEGLSRAEKMAVMTGTFASLLRGDKITTAQLWSLVRPFFVRVGPLSAVRAMQQLLMDRTWTVPNGTPRETASWLQEDLRAAAQQLGLLSANEDATRTRRGAIRLPSGLELVPSPKRGDLEQLRAIVPHVTTPPEARARALTMQRACYDQFSFLQRHHQQLERQPSSSALTCALEEAGRKSSGHGTMSWEWEVPIVDESAVQRDPVFHLPPIGRHYTDDWAKEDMEMGPLGQSRLIQPLGNNESHSLEEASQYFRGWRSGTEFSPLRRPVAASWSEFPALQSLYALAQRQGLCRETTFRFATPQDAERLWAINRINPAFRSVEDFAATLRARSEFVLVAERRGHVVGFVNYYLHWFSTREAPPGKRPPPQAVLYCATLQAVKPATHFDLMGFPDPNAVENAPVSGEATSPVRPSQPERPDSPPSASPLHPRSPAARRRRRQEAMRDEQECNWVDDPPAGQGRLTAAEREADEADFQPDPSSPPPKVNTVSAPSLQEYRPSGVDNSVTKPAESEPKDDSARSAFGLSRVSPDADPTNPGSEPRTGSLLFALACRHASSVGIHVVLVDATQDAVPYYQSVMEMHPMESHQQSGTPNAYVPMRLELQSASFARTVGFGAESQATERSSTVFQPEEDEIVDELTQLQESLRGTMTQNNRRITGLIARVADSADSARYSSRVRQMHRRLWRRWQRMTHRLRIERAAAAKKEEDEMAATCTLCGGGASHPKDQIVFCDSCDLAAHQLCYGVPVIPEGEWFCRSCHTAVGHLTQRPPGVTLPQHAAKPRDVPCGLCPVRGGGLLPAASDGMGGNTPPVWLHATCVMVHKAIDSECPLELDNDTTLDPVHGWQVARHGRRASQPSSGSDLSWWTKRNGGRRVCCLCGSSYGVTVRCDVEHASETDSRGKVPRVAPCRNYIHPMCAVQRGLALIVEETDLSPKSTVVSSSSSPSCSVLERRRLTTAGAHPDPGLFAAAVGRNRFPEALERRGVSRLSVHIVCPSCHQPTKVARDRPPWVDEELAARQRRMRRRQLDARRTAAAETARQLKDMPSESVSKRDAAKLAARAADQAAREVAPEGPWLNRRLRQRGEWRRSKQNASAAPGQQLESCWLDAAGMELFPDLARPDAGARFAPEHVSRGQASVPETAVIPRADSEREQRLLRPTDVKRAQWQRQQAEIRRERRRQLRAASRTLRRVREAHERILIAPIRRNCVAETLAGAPTLLRHAMRKTSGLGKLTLAQSRNEPSPALEGEYGSASVQSGGGAAGGGQDEEAGDDGEEEDDDVPLCICRKTYREDSSMMLSCDSCDEWFHLRCMGLIPHPSDPTVFLDKNARPIEISRWYCPSCDRQKRAPGGGSAVSTPESRAVPAREDTQENEESLEPSAKRARLSNGDAKAVS